LQPEQIERAYQSSGGVPGQVNDWVMQRLRRSPEQRPTRRWIPGLAPVVARPKLKYLLGVLAAVPLLLILLNQDAINRLFSPDPADTRPERGAPLADNDDDAAESTVVTLPLPPPAPVVEEPLIPPEAAEDARSSPAEPPVANAPEQRPAESPLPEAEPQPAPAAARSSTDAEPPAQTASDASVVADVAAGTDVEAPQPPAEPEPQPPPEPEPAVAERFEDRGWRKEAWLLRQSPTAYSLQILGVSDEAAMQRFIRRSGVKNGLMYFQSVRNDRPWYSLLYGLYDNRQLAAAAIERLPKALRKPGIWPRALKAVQQEIRERPR